MAADVVWLDQSRDDLREILDFISIENPAAATNYLAGLHNACRRLVDFPLSGRRYDDKFRVLTLRNHLIFHFDDKATNVVSIAMVVDGRRDLKQLFGESARWSSSRIERLQLTGRKPRAAKFPTRRCLAICGNKDHRWST